MGTYLIEYFDIIISLLAGALFAQAMLPVILRIAVRRHLYDATDSRKIHKGDVPRLGGVSFMPSLAMSLLSVIGFNLIYGSEDIMAIFARDIRFVIFGALAITGIYGVGLADDIFGVRYRLKFGIQILCGILLVCSGIGVSSFFGVAGIHELHPWIGVPFTILMTVFVINAMNLIDGIDGLAAMTAQIAMLTYGIAFILAGDTLGAMIAAATWGVTVPFLRYNLFGKTRRRTKIFMGDTGSMTLGLITVALGMRVLSIPGIPDSTNPAALALAPVIVPCFDVVRVYFIRILAHRSPFLPDRNHIHHRLLDLGLSQRRALAVIISWSAIMTALNILLGACININLVLLTDIALWQLCTSLLFSAVKRRKTIAD